MIDTRSARITSTSYKRVAAREGTEQTNSGARYTHPGAESVCARGGNWHIEPHEADGARPRLVARLFPGGS